MHPLHEASTFFFDACLALASCPAGRSFFARCSKHGRRPRLNSLQPGFALGPQIFHRRVLEKLRLELLQVLLLPGNFVKQRGLLKNIIYISYNIYIYYIIYIYNIYIYMSIIRFSTISSDMFHVEHMCHFKSTVQVSLILQVYY